MICNTLLGDNLLIHLVQFIVGLKMYRRIATNFATSQSSGCIRRQRVYSRWVVLDWQQQGGESTGEESWLGFCEVKNCVPTEKSLIVLQLPLYCCHQFARRSLQRP